MLIKLIQILIFFFAENFFEEFFIDNFSTSTTDIYKNIPQEEKIINDQMNDSKKEVLKENRKIKIVTIIIVFTLLCIVSQEPSFGGDDAFFSNL